jgi:CubicO group peptidase (beta-lactamase class C family)/uncharacterized protein (DUF302 family)
MMRTLTTMLLATMTLLASAQTTTTMRKYENQLPMQGRGNVHVAYQGQSIDQMIYDFMEAEGIPGMTLAIVQAPYIPRVVGYGVTDLDYKKLATEKTLWSVGPISQAFAAVAIMQLFERGKLTLNDKMGQYLKGLPKTWAGITIKQLLQHSTGIADYRKMPGYDVAADIPESRLLDYAYSQPLAFRPGTDVQQSATNFLLVADVVEAVSGMAYEQFVRENQIDYLGLKQTFFTSELDKVKREDISKTGGRHKTFTLDKDYINPSEPSTGYVDKDGQLVASAVQAPHALKGFSDIWASAENISHWDIGLAGGVLIAKPENRAMIYKPTTLDNGNVVPAMAGWQFYAHKGLMDIKGNSPGHSAFLSRFTDTSELVCVTLLANKEGVELTNLARRIAAAFDTQKLGTGANDNELYTFESQFGVKETMNRIEANLKKNGVPVFGKYDHEANAQGAGLSLSPTQVIVFGAPKVGTQLMQQNPSIAIELPLRISVWQDAAGSVWVNFPQMDKLAARYGMADHPVIKQMQKMLENLTVKSASVY